MRKSEKTKSPKPTKKRGKAKSRFSEISKIMLKLES